MKRASFLAVVNTLALFGCGGGVGTDTQAQAVQAVPTASAGRYYLSYDNGKPFVEPPKPFSITHNASIAIGTEYQAFVPGPTVAVLDRVVGYNGSGFLEMELGGVLSIGVQPYGNVGRTIGQFNADGTAFTWSLDVPLTYDNFFENGGLGGVVTHVHLAQSSSTEVEEWVKHVRDDYNSQNSPGPGDFVTDKYVLQRR